MVLRVSCLIVRIYDFSFLRTRDVAKCVRNLSFPGSSLWNNSNAVPVRVRQNAWHIVEGFCPAIFMFFFVLMDMDMVEQDSVSIIKCDGGRTWVSHRIVPEQFCSKW